MKVFFISDFTVALTTSREPYALLYNMAKTH